MQYFLATYLILQSHCFMNIIDQLSTNHNKSDLCFIPLIAVVYAAPC